MLWFGFRGRRFRISGLGFRGLGFKGLLGFTGFRGFGFKGFLGFINESVLARPTARLQLRPALQCHGPPSPRLSFAGGPGRVCKA